MSRLSSEKLQYFYLGNENNINSYPLGCCYEMKQLMKVFHTVTGTSQVLKSWQVWWWGPQVLYTLLAVKGVGGCMRCL